jgi:hypothetical protein
MAKTRITFDAVRTMALALPEVEERLYYGKPAFFIRGRMFACEASHSSAEPDSLVVRIDFEPRAELVAAEPAVYYLTDHYVGYASVLVRLSKVHPDAMRGLLRTAHTFVSAAQARGTRTRPRTARKRPTS